MSFALLLFVVLSAVVLVAIGLLFQSAISGGSKVSDSPYRKCPYLMSASEQRFFAALREADSDTHWLFTKVRLADLVTTQTGLDKTV